MPTELDIEAILKALSNPVRREILAWLKTPDVHFPNQTLPYEHGVCAGQIDARCGLSQSTVSAHLATLQRAGLVTSTRIGQWAFSSATRPSSTHFTTHCAANSSQRPNRPCGPPPHMTRRSSRP